MPMQLPHTSKHGHYVYTSNELEQEAEIRKAEKHQRKRDRLRRRYCSRCLVMSALLAIIGFCLAEYTFFSQRLVWIRGSLLFSSESKASLDHAAATLSIASAPRIAGKAAHDRIQVMPNTSDFYFARNDCEWFRRWPLGKSSCKRLPRVLVWTWATEDMLTRFHNEAYWKSCYAHAHGFDIEFTGVKSVSGVKQYNTSDNSIVVQWYSDENMWAWIPAIKAHLSSGKYDYVYYTGADTLVHYTHFTFPVWAWDTGHDLTIMDQHVDSWGLNINSVLFRASSWTLKFLDTYYSHRKNFNLQGDNGPYMETILTHVGGLLYKHACAGPLVLDMPSAMYFGSEEGLEEYTRLNNIYSNCFFKELDRLTGPYGSRKSEHIGFSNTVKEGHLPWANCWTLVRTKWPDPDKNCFALHWNGAKPPGHRSYADGLCPNPSFNWELAPYNIDNPRRPKYY